MPVRIVTPYSCQCDPGPPRSKAGFTMVDRAETVYYFDSEKAGAMTFQCAQLGYTGLISYSTAKEKAGS